MFRIALTGVESVGKTTLAHELATHYKTICIPEYARTYLAGKADYAPEDVLYIAQKQIELQALKHDKIVFYDTELTVIKIWYETKYHTTLPAQIAEAYLHQHFDLYLLPYPDLVWQADTLREAPDLQARVVLFEKYEIALKELNRPYHIIRGAGRARLRSALEVVEKLQQ